MNISFYKIEEALLLSYHYFTTQVSNNDLKELNSFKIRNIFSIVFNKETKNLILNDLFNEKGIFLSSETKHDLFRFLSLEERNELKEYLNTYLKYQIESNWYKTLKKELHSKSINRVLIPTTILRNDKIIAELKELFPRKRFVDWSSYNGNSSVLIIDYNHAWKKRNLFTVQDPNSIAFFLKHFFENIYQWKIYKEDKHLFNRMKTQTRETLLGENVLSEINEKLISLRPQKLLNEWDLLHDRDHKSYCNPPEEIVIYSNSTSNNRYRITSSFILEKDKKYTVKTAKELISNPSKFQGEYKISSLEKIISEIDLNEFNNAIEKDENGAKIIQSISDKFKLKEEDGEIWKQLLLIKSKEDGINEVFSRIEEISGIKDFVSLTTFENTYCNTLNSTIIPREKKVFKSICQYLNLPLEYRAQIHRRRNLIGGHSQELHINLKKLIKAIIDCNILKEYSDDDALLETLNQSVEKIEKEVDMEFFGFSSKDPLIYACIQICFEIIDKMRLKPIAKIEHIVPN